MSFIDDALTLVEAGSIEDWKSRCRFLAGGLGYEFFLYVALPGRNICQDAIFHGNYPEPWRTRYEEKQYHFIDPVLIHAFGNATPLAWGSALFASPEQRAFYGEAREFGIKTGACTSLNGLRENEFVMLALASSDEKRPFDKQQKEKLLLKTHLLAIYAHEAVIRLGAGCNATRWLSIGLTEREKESLKWLAAGKTNWEIAQILNCSERTVKYHVQNICQKFNVTNRHHAAIRAVALGIVAI